MEISHILFSLAFYLISFLYNVFSLSLVCCSQTGERERNSSFADPGRLAQKYVLDSDDDRCHTIEQHTAKARANVLSHKHSQKLHLATQHTANAGEQPKHTRVDMTKHYAKKQQKKNIDKELCKISPWRECSILLRRVIIHAIHKLLRKQSQMEKLCVLSRKTYYQLESGTLGVKGAGYRIGWKW